MSISATCTQCGASFSLSDALIGKKVRCKMCEEVFVVDGPEEAPATAPPVRAMSRRRREDEDDEYPRSRRPARGGAIRRKSTGPSGLLLVAAVVGIVLLLSCGLGSYAVYQWREKQRDKLEEEFEKAGLMPGETPTTLDSALADLRSGDSRRRRVAAKWLAGQPLEPARQAEIAQALEDALADKEPTVPVAALWALDTWATRANVPKMIQLLNQIHPDKADDMQRRAMVILGRFPDPQGAAAVARYLPNAFFNENARNSLQAMGKVAEKAVLEYMHDPDCHDRARALLLVYGTSHSDQVRQSALDLTSPEEHHRHSAAEWLARTEFDAPNQATTFAALIQAIRNDVDRDLTIEALGIWATAGDAQTLLDLLKDPANSRIRWQCMILLGKFKYVPAIPTIAARLAVNEDRTAACQALEAMGPAAREELMKYLESADPRVREDVTRVLKKLVPNDNVDLTRAVKYLKSPDPRLRLEATTWFARQTEAVKEVRAEVALGLVKCLDERFTPQCAQAARALRTWATTEEVPAMLKAIDHLEDHVRRDVIETLGKLKDQRSIPPLVLRLAANKDREQVSAALQAMGPTVETEVVKLFTVVDRGIRIEACHILEAVGTRASLPELDKAGKIAGQRKEKDVQDAAETASKAILGRP